MEKNNVSKDNNVILGDSTIKDVDGWKLSRLLRSKDKRIKVMHFSRAATACMESYIKTTLKQNADKVNLHFGTSDLRPTKEPLEITSIIIDLTKMGRKLLRRNYIENFTEG